MGLQILSYTDCIEICPYFRGQLSDSGTQSKFWIRPVSIKHTNLQNRPQGKPGLTSIQPTSMFADFLSICFIAVETVLINLNTPIWKAWGSASRALRPLTTGIVRRQFPSLRGTTRRNNGRSAWNGSRFEHIPFTWRLHTFTGWKWKCHVIIAIKADLSGFVVPMHSGLCEQYVKPLGLTHSGLDFLFRTRPRALGQQTPPEPVLIPYSNMVMVKYLIWANEMACFGSCDRS